MCAVGIKRRGKAAPRLGRAALRGARGVRCAGPRRAFAADTDNLRPQIEGRGSFPAGSPTLTCATRLLLSRVPTPCGEC